MSIRSIKYFLKFLVFSLVFLLLFEVNSHVFHFHGGKNPLLYLNPYYLLEDESFNARLNSNFTAGSEHIKQWWQMLIGVGFGKSRTNDSLYFSLLINTGFLGLFTYIFFLFRIIIERFQLLPIICFIFFNGIMTETTINSYRSIHLILLPIIILYRWPLWTYSLKKDNYNL